MKKIKNVLLTFISCIVIMHFSISNIYACTAVYVGGDASDDGTTIIAKSNDYQANWGNYVTITERVEDTPGRTMPVDNDATVFADLPATTYRYTSTPWFDSTTEQNGLGHDATVCTNEYGVAMIMSITSFSNEAALEADPLIDNGLSEFTAVDLVTCQSQTAREAVEVLLGLIDQYGSSEVNIALIADQTETWYVEMYNGHQYAAVKLPSDMVAAFGNEFSLEYVEDYEDYIVSEDLESLAKENDFAVYDENNRLNLLKTYSGEEVVTNYSHMRTWIGHQILSEGYEEYDKDDIYPLTFKAGKKVSIDDVFEIMRNRFDGTEYSPDETGRTDMRVIGTDTALSVHAVQIYSDLPADYSCVTWESSGPAVYGVFVPVSNGATSISEPYSLNQSAEEVGNFDTNTYPYYRFKGLNTLCIDSSAYKTYGEPVRAYFHEAEENMISTLADVLKEASTLSDDEAKEYITNYCNYVQTQAFDDAGQLLNDVLWYMSQNSNTMKNGRNPETGEANDTVKVYDPLTVTLDASVYKEIPTSSEEADTPSEEETTTSSTNIGLPLFTGIGAVILIAMYFEEKKNKK